MYFKRIGNREYKMEKLEWKENYLLGNQSIDKEHQIFAELINKLIQAEVENRENDYLDRIILEIQKYAEFHFVSEENYMLDVEFPGLKNHQKQHSMLLEEFNLALNYLELEQKSYTDFISFLLAWFKGHTVAQDKKIVDYLNHTNGRA